MSNTKIINRPLTYPNQRTVKIHREPERTNFLGIKNENWQAASRNMKPHALLLYLYLAANADDFTLALSPAAIRKEIGMPRSTFHDQFHILEDKGYIVHNHGNTYDFYEVPQPRADKQIENSVLDNGLDFENGTKTDNGCSNYEQSSPQKIIEINNINNFNKYSENKYETRDETKEENLMSGFVF